MECFERSLSRERLSHSEDKKEIECQILIDRDLRFSDIVIFVSMIDNNEQMDSGLNTKFKNPSIERKKCKFYLIRSGLGLFFMSESSFLLTFEPGSGVFSRLHPDPQPCWKLLHFHLRNIPINFEIGKMILLNNRKLISERFLNIVFVKLSCGEN